MTGGCWPDKLYVIASPLSLWATWSRLAAISAPPPLPSPLDPIVVPPPPPPSLPSQSLCNLPRLASSARWRSKGRHLRSSRCVVVTCNAGDSISYIVVCRRVCVVRPTPEGGVAACGRVAHPTPGCGWHPVAGSARLTLVSSTAAAAATTTAAFSDTAIFGEICTRSVPWCWGISR